MNTQQKLFWGHSYDISVDYKNKLDLLFLDQTQSMVSQLVLTFFEKGLK